MILLAGKLALGSSPFLSEVSAGVLKPGGKNGEGKGGAMSNRNDFGSSVTGV